MCTLFNIRKKLCSPLVSLLPPRNSISTADDIAQKPDGKITNEGIQNLTSWRTKLWISQEKYLSSLEPMQELEGNKEYSQQYTQLTMLFLMVGCGGCGIKFIQGDHFVSGFQRSYLLHGVQKRCSSDRGEK